tara:strand:- start:250 stop:594 length:345 start_codon:yes stop_codon:yes gene_type:complete
MKSLLVVGALLLSATPAVAQFDRDSNCIRNKESEMQKYESLLQMAIQKSQQPELIVDLARQMEEVNHFSSDLSQRQKNGIAYKLMTDQITQMKRQLEGYKTLPDCAELQGGKSQ